MNIALTNYPRESNEGAIRPVAFGFGGKTTILIELEAPDDTEDIDINVTVGNGPENSGVPDFLNDIAEALKIVAEESAPEIAAELKRKGEVL